MATSPILITSFQPWRAHQASNSSDDLILALHADGQLPHNSIWIRNVPVSFELAPIRVISALCQYRPRAIICCGMTENRPHLSIEQQAKHAEKTLYTSIDLQRLLKHTQLSEISYDAGSYVCNALYYSVLESIQAHNLPTAAIFAHIPILRGACKRLVQDDFLSITQQLASITQMGALR